jgi:hypothetical protein
MSAVQLIIFRLKMVSTCSPDYVAPKGRAPIRWVCMVSILLIVQCHISSVLGAAGGGLGGGGAGWAYDMYPWGNNQPRASKASSASSTSDSDETTSQYTPPQHTTLQHRQNVLLNVFRENLDLYVHEEYVDKYFATIPPKQRYVRQIDGYKYHINLVDSVHSRASPTSQPTDGSGRSLALADSPDPYETDIHHNPEAFTRFLSGKE